jgi:hypothetical protein
MLFVGIGIGQTRLFVGPLGNLLPEKPYLDARLSLTERAFLRRLDAERSEYGMRNIRQPGATIHIRATQELKWRELKAAIAADKFPRVYNLTHGLIKKLPSGRTEITLWELGSELEPARHAAIELQDGPFDPADGGTEKNPQIVPIRVLMLPE